MKCLASNIQDHSALPAPKVVIVIVLLGELLPMLLKAVTVNIYSVSGISPVTIIESSSAVTFPTRTPSV